MSRPFQSLITDVDKYLIGDGTHYRTYEKMGAHPHTMNGVKGIHFAVLAPNANKIRIVGDFNDWDGSGHDMQRLEDSGLWVGFVPALPFGTLYKYEMFGDNTYHELKTDPYGFGAELRPQTASMIWDIDQYQWNDAAWLDQRKNADWLRAPTTVYEVHLGSWKRSADGGFMTYRELADQLIPYVKDMGFSHIELMPITEHPFDGSWGYQTIGYFAPTSRFGSPDDFKFFVDRCHQENIGVIVDWVPAHFPKDGHGLAYFDGTHLFEHQDPRQGEHMDWGTLIFNYGRNEVKTFLLSSAVFWADIYHIDGIRVDAVASMLYLDYSREEGQWIPNRYGGRENLEAIEFTKTFNEVMHAEYPGIMTFAEESTSFPKVSRPLYDGGLGFGLKWNMGWMNDTLEYISKDTIHRKHHQNDLTFSMVYAFNENFILPFSHDEVVHGKGSMIEKMPGDEWQKFANLRLLYTYMYAHPGKKLLFMGCEFAQWEEWNADASLSWNLLEFDRHAQIQSLVRDLNHFYTDEAAMHEEDFSNKGFEWIDYQDAENSVLTFIRKSTEGKEAVLCVFNFTPVYREGYQIGVPDAGAYEVVFSSDAGIFGGGDSSNPKVIDSVPGHCQHRDHSIQLNIGSLSGTFLKIKAPAVSG